MMKDNNMLQVQIFLDEEDRHEDQPLDECIMRYLMHHGMKGATLFKGYMGFGSGHHLNEPSKLTASDPLPVMIVFVDDENKVNDIIPNLKKMISKSLMTIQRVDRI